MEKDKNNKYNSDVTKEDQELLGDRSGNLRHDGGDDKMLKNREDEVDFEAKNLDVPSRKDTAATGKNPVKDEENKHYSVSGERHQDLEERERP